MGIDQLELDDLKQVWRDAGKDLGAASPQKSKSELLAMTMRKADGILSKLARNFWWEIALGAVCCVLALFTMLYAFDVVTALLLFAGILVPSVWVYLLLGRMLFGGSDRSVGMIQSIEATVERMESFERKYLKMVVVACCLAFVYLQLVKNVARGDGFALTIHDAWRFLLMFVFIVVTAPFAKWLLRKIYGQHISRLKDCELEFRDADSDSITSIAEILPGGRE